MNPMRDRGNGPGRGPERREGELSMREGPWEHDERRGGWEPRRRPEGMREGGMREGGMREGGMREGYGARERGYEREDRWAGPGGGRDYVHPGFGRDEIARRMTERRWRRGRSRARDVMTRNVRTVHPHDSVQQLARIMIDEDCGIVPVTEDDGRLLGVVTDRDIVCRLIARGIDLRDARARDIMTSEVECVTEDESIHAVLRLMAEHQVRRIPVVARGDRLVGIIAMADLAREADVDEELQDTFDEISSERSFWSRLR